MKLAVGFAASLWISCVRPFVPHNFLSRTVFVGNLYSVAWNTFRGILCQLLWLWRLSGCWKPEKFCADRDWYGRVFFFLSLRLFYLRCRLFALALCQKFSQGADSLPDIGASTLGAEAAVFPSFMINT